MFMRVLQRKDIRDLINNFCSCDKTSNDSFFDAYQQLLLFLDGLYKFCVIIEDEYYLDQYILQVTRLFKKIDNPYDIMNGINIILGNICCLKLGFDDKESVDTKQTVLKYVYNKYIVNGYLFHGFSSIYKDDIAANGFVPEVYKNLYTEFRDVDKIFSQHKVVNIMQKNFNVVDVCLTDNFSMALTYAINSPNYFYKLLCDNEFSEKANVDKNAYFACNYGACFNNLNKIMNLAKLSGNEKKNVIKAFSDEWNLLNKSNSSIDILCVKRSKFNEDSLSNFESVLKQSQHLSLGESIGILLLNCNDIKVNEKIDSKDIEFIRIDNFLHLDKRKIVNNKANDININNEYGKVSILILIASILIILGVLLTIIMVSGGF